MSATAIHDREALLQVTTEAINLLDEAFRVAEGVEVIPLAEQMREMIRLHNEILTSANSPALKGHKQPKGEFDDLMKV
jgi:hypothetical protein